MILCVVVAVVCLVVGAVAGKIYGARGLAAVEAELNDIEVKASQEVKSVIARIRAAI